MKAGGGIWGMQVLGLGKADNGTVDYLRRERLDTEAEKLFS